MFFFSTAVFTLSFSFGGGGGGGRLFSVVLVCYCVRDLGKHASTM